MIELRKAHHASQLQVLPTFSEITYHRWSQISQSTVAPQRSVLTLILSQSKYSNYKWLATSQYADLNCLGDEKLARSLRYMRLTETSPPHSLLLPAWEPQLIPAMLPGVPWAFHWWSIRKKVLCGWWQGKEVTEKAAFWLMIWGWARPSKPWPSLSYTLHPVSSSMQLLLSCLLGWSHSGNTKLSSF